MTKQKPFDIESIFTKKQANEGTEFEIVMPDGTKTGAFIRMLGFESKVYREYQAKKARESVKQKQKDLTPEELAEKQHVDMVEMFTELTVDWRGLSAEFSKERAYNAFDQSEVLRKLALAHVTSESSFLPNA